MSSVSHVIIWTRSTEQDQHVSGDRLTYIHPRQNWYLHSKFDQYPAFLHHALNVPRTQSRQDTVHYAINWLLPCVIMNFTIDLFTCIIIYFVCSCRNIKWKLKWVPTIIVIHSMLVLWKPLESFSTYCCNIKQKHSVGENFEKKIEVKLLTNQNYKYLHCFICE